MALSRVGADQEWALLLDKEHGLVGDEISVDAEPLQKVAHCIRLGSATAFTFLTLLLLLLMKKRKL